MVVCFSLKKALLSLAFGALVGAFIYRNGQNNALTQP